METKGILIGLGVGAAVAAGIYFFMRRKDAKPAAVNPAASWAGSGGGGGQFVPGVYTGTNRAGQTIEPIAIKSPFQVTQPVLTKAIESQTSPFITVRTKSVVTEPTPVPSSSPSPIIQAASSGSGTTTTSPTTSPFASTTKKTLSGLFDTHI